MTPTPIIPKADEVRVMAEGQRCDHRHACSNVGGLFTCGKCGALVLPSGNYIPEDDHLRVVGAMQSRLNAILETLGRDGTCLKTEPTEDEKRVEGLEYRGKSVWSWWAKAHAYGCMVHGINPILGAKDGEYTNDAARRVVAERDDLAKRVEQGNSRAPSPAVGGEKGEVTDEEVHYALNTYAYQMERTGAFTCAMRAALEGFLRGRG